MAIEIKRTCEEKKNKTDKISETLLQKNITLILETQLQRS
jgi:hypothetical protein